MIASP
jgi:hypothetical protein